MASMNEHAQVTEYCRCLCLLTVANSLLQESGSLVAVSADELRVAVMGLSSYMNCMNNARFTCDFVRDNRPDIESLLAKEMAERPVVRKEHTCKVIRYDVEDGDTWLICSECGAHWLLKEEFKHCPKCGAMVVRDE